MDNSNYTFTCPVCGFSKVVSVRDGKVNAKEFTVDEIIYDTVIDVVDGDAEVEDMIVSYSCPGCSVMFSDWRKFSKTKGLNA